MRDALGRVLGEDVYAPLNLPPWDNASMDGYAVRCHDDVRTASGAAPVVLSVIGTIAAGATATRALAQGEAYRIMTGAPVPPGADSVVRVEDTDRGVERVCIQDSRDALRNIRSRGEDLAIGSLALPRGVHLGPGHLGVLASVGCAHVQVHRRPRVAILCQPGDELVDIDRFDEVLRGERIVTSNSYTLEALVRTAGGEALSLGLVHDDPEAIRARLASAPPYDLLLTSGGVSVGEYDHRMARDRGAGRRTSTLLASEDPPRRADGIRHARRRNPMAGSCREILYPTMVTFELFARPGHPSACTDSRACFRVPCECVSLSV